MKKYFTVRQFAEANGFTEAQVRWWLFQRERNGLLAAGGVVKIAGRLYIDPAGFQRWVAAQNPEHTQAVA